MKAIVLRRNGGPDVLKLEDVSMPRPGKGEVRVSVRFAGVNFAEILSRKGIYGWAPEKPYVPGMECSGIIEETGEGVDESRVGEAVMVGAKYGSYAEHIVVPGANAVPVIDGFSFEEAASFLVNYMTAWVALFRMARAGRGEKVLITAAAGGVGTAAVQLAARSGCEVYGMAGSAEKLDLIRSLGAVSAFDYRDPDCFKSLIALTGGVDVVIEMVGGDTFRKSMDSLNPFGRLVVTGFASLDLNKWNPASWWRTWRDMPRADVGLLATKSAAVMSSHLGYLLDREPEIMTGLYGELREFTAAHGIRPVVNMVFGLGEAALAHEYMESRKSTGKVLLRIG
ncbi:MAG TPA: NADPH:quinone oxidoreductase family protein [Thermodesulfobacteriota bacterium]|nr:NADPH:quinone oxidoreductase family protein [Thermodesulfobacteriota bacterium]